MLQKNSHIKVLVILDKISKALEHEWFVDMINRDRFKIEFVLIDAKDSEMDLFLQSRKVRTYHYSCANKKGLPALIFRLFQLIRKQKYDVVHAHLSYAYIAGMVAARLAGVHKRIITRHHSDLHHTWHSHAVKYDKLINLLATDIVAISSVVKEILTDWEDVSLSKIHLIPHGIKMELFTDTPQLQTTINLLKEKYKLQNEGPIIGVISRFTEWKGVQFIIGAFSEILIDHPDAVLVIANAFGDFEAQINRLLIEIPPNRVRLIRFENEMPALYRLFDVFVHVPVSRESEAFGQVYLEALASEIPSIFTLSGVACDFAVDKRNCLLVPYRDSAAIRDAVKVLLQDKNLCRLLTEQAKNDISSYTAKEKILKLEHLYSEV